MKEPTENFYDTKLILVNNNVIMLYLLFFFSCYILLFLNERYRLTICNHYLNIGLRQPINLLVLLLLAILAGGRAITVGTDVGTYAVFHFGFNAELSNLMELYNKHILEIGYELENYLVTRFTNDIHWALFFNSVTVMLGLYFGGNFWSKKLNLSFSLIILFFLLTGCYNVSLNAIRQYMAVTTVFGFSKFFYERKFVLSCIGIFIASSFHQSALVGFIIYSIFSKNNKLFYLEIIIIFLGFFLVVPFFIKINLLPSRFIRYFSDTPLDQGGPLLAISECVYIIMALTIHKKQGNNFGLFFIKIAILSVAFAFMKPFFGAVFRLYFYFDLFNVVLLVLFIKKVFFKYSFNKIILYLCFIIFYSIFWWWKYVYQNYENTVPYLWTWSIFT